MVVDREWGGGDDGTRYVGGSSNKHKWPWIHVFLGENRLEGKVVFYILALGRIGCTSRRCWGRVHVDAIGIRSTRMEVKTGNCTHTSVGTKRSCTMLICRRGGRGLF